MIITSITQQKNDPSRYSIFVDDEFAFGLILQDIAYFKLKEGAEISEKTYGYIKDSLNYIKAQNAALNYVGYKMRTAKEVRNKLSQKEFAAEVIDNVIAFLEKYKYVDDFDYCRKYITQRQRLSPRGIYALKAELRQKGAPLKFIEQAILEANIDEYASALSLLQKKCRRLDNIDEKQRQKLSAFLQRRGYSYDTIKEALSNLELED